MSEVTTSVLQAEHLRFAYGDVTAVWDVSIEARSGQITVLLGQNGAGKTTLLGGLAGLLTARAGSIRLAGRDVTGAGAWKRTHYGISMVQEGKRIFRDLTVHENLVVSVPRGKGRINERIDSIYERFPRLAEMRRRVASDLSGGQQQLLAVAQALASDPQVLLVDEPSSGLSPQAFDQILEVIVSLKQQGMAIILVEQQIEEMLSGIGDQLVVMERGHITLSDAAANVTSADVLSRFGLN